MNYIISEAFDKLRALEEERFSYDKEQEFTSKSTAHGNGVANKGMGRVPALFKNVRNWKPGTVNFDYGCGEATTQAQIANFLAEQKSRVLLLTNSTKSADTLTQQLALMF